MTLIFAITVVSIALPAVQRDLGLRPGQLALVSAGYGLTFSGLLLLGGRLADVVGPRRVLVGGLVVFAAASVGAATATSFVGLLGARLLQGVGGALAAPAAMALVHAVYLDPSRRRRALGLWGSLAPIGATTGIVVSGIATAWASWRWGFVPPALVATAVAVVARRVLPEDEPRSGGELDVAGSALVTITVSALTFGLVTAPDQGWTASSVATALALSGLAAAALVAVEARTRSPIIPIALFGSARRSLAFGTVLVSAAGHASLGFFLALYFQQVRDLSPLVTSAAFLPFCVVLVVAGPAAARVAAAVGARTATVAGLGVAAIGLLLVARLGSDGPYVGPVLVGLLVFPAGVALAFAGGTVAGADGVESGQAGAVGGVVNTAIELGPTIGLAGLVSISSTRAGQLRAAGHGAAEAAVGGYRLAFLVAATTFVAVALATAFLSSNKPNQQEDISA